MSKMSDLDLMVRDGERTAEDFIRRGFDARTARAMAAVVEACEDAIPAGCRLESIEDCSGPPAYLPARHPIRLRHQLEQDAISDAAESDMGTFDENGDANW